MKIAVHTEIDAPAPNVWAALADFGAIEDWADVIDKATFHPADEGAVGAARVCAMGGITLHETITAWQEGHSLTYTISGLPMTHYALVQWHLEPIATITRVTVTAEMHATGGPAGRLLEWTGLPLLAKESYRDLLKDFKTYVEAQEAA